VRFSFAIVALLVVLAAPASTFAAGPAPVAGALSLPATWKVVIPGVGNFAAWRNGVSTYTGRFLRADESTESLLRRIEHPSTSPSNQIEVRHQRLTRCGSTVGLTTARTKSDSGAISVLEALDYAQDGAWFNLDYNRPDGTADPDIERIFHETCPSEIPFVSAPHEWQDIDKGIYALFRPVDKSIDALVQLSASPATLPPAPADAGVATASPLGAAISSSRVRTGTACGIPLLVVEGATVRGDKTVDVLATLSQYGGRRYLARYEHPHGAEDRATRSAILALCAKPPFNRWTGNSAAFAAESTPEPVVSIPINVPKSARATLQTTPPVGNTASLPEHIVELGAANGAFQATTTVTHGDVAQSTQHVAIGDTVYDEVGGTWYKRHSNFVIDGGAYPNFYLWRGTLTQSPDEIIGGVAVNVYRFTNRDGYTNVWVGAADRYIRRTERHTYVTRGRPEEGSVASIDYDRFNDAITIEQPHDYFDETDCASGVGPLRAINVVRPRMPAGGPLLKAPVTVALYISVSIDGLVTNAAVVRSSGYPILDTEAIRATRATTFAPPLVYCHPSALDGRYDVEFSAQ
jgi:TonB family protein